MNFKRFRSELVRRNVIKSGLAYLVSSWVFLQVMAIILPTIEAPAYISKLFLFLLIFFFPIWIIFSWIYEITPDGIKKTVSIEPEKSISQQTSNNLNKIILGVLGIAIILLLFDLFESRSHANEIEIVTSSQESGRKQNPVNTSKSIAVLAFADMSEEKDQEYFSDGISEEILNLLAKLPELKVISRTSSFSFKGKGVTTDEIGKELNVSHILEGSVRKYGNRLRITAQLINVSDGSHLWSETFDRDMEDIFSIQDEIAEEVTNQLRVKLLGKHVKTVNPEAYNLFLQAKFLMQQSTEEANRNAEKLISQSIEIDSTYAPSWAILGLITYRASVNYTYEQLDRITEFGIPAVNKAIELDPEYALAYAYLSILQSNIWEFEKGALNSKKAMELDPENAEVIIYSTYNNFEDPATNISLVKRAIELDPLSYYNYYLLGFYRYFNNQPEEAQTAMEKYELHQPNAEILHALKSWVLLYQGKTQEALIEIEKEKNDFFKTYTKCMVVYELGRVEEANSLLEIMLDKYPEEYANIGHVYALRGETDTAFEWFEKALETRDPTLPELIYYPSLKVLYKDPRWSGLISRMGLPKNHGVPGI